MDALKIRRAISAAFRLAGQPPSASPSNTLIASSARLLRFSLRIHAGKCETVGRADRGREGRRHGGNG